MASHLMKILKNNLYSGRSMSHKFILKNTYDNDYLTDPQNRLNIEHNIKIRKGVGNIQLVHDLKEQLDRGSLKDKSLFEKELRKIPNKTHPAVRDYGEEPKVVEYYNDKPTFKSKPLEFSEICKKMNILRTEYLGNFTGHRSYYLMNDLVDLEQALIKYTLDKIMAHDFKLISVPDILPAAVIESCGMTTDGERNQVYRLLPSNLCLSGTSEMALAGYFAGSRNKLKDLPLKYTAVSRCFRAETSSLQEEKGIYRVHQFTKVEMFSVCQEDQSERLLEEFKEIEIDLFKSIGLHFQLLDMPPCELGAPAYRKFDIEAWMPGRGMWGEISSCSNCTDYQSRRLDIKVDDNTFAHTVNGTACAVPRMLIAIIETFQNDDGTITVPKVLRKYLKKDLIVKKKKIPELKLVKNIMTK